MHIIDEVDEQGVLLPSMHPTTSPFDNVARYLTEAGFEQTGTQCRMKLKKIECFL